MTEVDIQLSVSNDVLIAILDGEIDFSNTSDVEERLLQAVGNDNIGMAIDLTLTRYIDSAGVRMLFNIAGRLRASRQAIAVVLPESSPVRRLMDVTNLSSVLTICGMIDDCLMGMRSDVQDPA